MVALLDVYRDIHVSISSDTSDSFTSLLTHVIVELSCDNIIPPNSVVRHIPPGVIIFPKCI